MSAIDLPTYIKLGGFENQQKYFELQSLILTQWFSSNGFFLPALTSTQITALQALSPTPRQLIFMNSTTNKIQFLDPTGTLQTVTSV